MSFHSRISYYNFLIIKEKKWKIKSLLVFFTLLWNFNGLTSFLSLQFLSFLAFSHPSAREATESRRPVWIHASMLKKILKTSGHERRYRKIILLGNSRILTCHDEALKVMHQPVFYTIKCPINERFYYIFCFYLCFWPWLSTGIHHWTTL